MSFNISEIQMKKTNVKKQIADKILISAAKLRKLKQQEEYEEYKRNKKAQKDLDN